MAIAFAVTQTAPTSESVQIAPEAGKPAAGKARPCCVTVYLQAIFRI
jgi:hypothetical protein